MFGSQLGKAIQLGIYPNIFYHTNTNKCQERHGGRGGGLIIDEQVAEIETTIREVQIGRF
mgnify:CR=1 FL=1